MGRVLTFICATMLLVTISEARADDRREIIEDIFRNTQVREIGQDIANNILKQILPVILSEVRKKNSNVSTDLEEKLVAEIQIELIEKLPGFYDMLADRYADVFTRDELLAMREFYDSDMGRSIAKKGAVLGAEAAILGQIWGQEAGKRAFRRAAEKATELGYKI